MHFEIRRAMVALLLLNALPTAVGVFAPRCLMAKEAETAGKTAEVRKSDATFESGGKKINAEVFKPEAAGKYPVVLLVHGADGLKHHFLGYDAMARGLAGDGFLVVLPHYFERTDTDWGDEQTNKKYFAVWMKTLGDAIEFGLKQEGADGEHVGLVGFSLGSYLSLSEASLDPRVSAVVEFFGGLPPAFDDKVKKFPPTLILHGDKDHIVPVSEARRLEKLLKDNERRYEVKIYKGQDHGFRGAALEDSMRRARDFLRQNLKPADAGGK